ncbi:MAG: hypothetical protein M1835_002146, partial [Candelina submexicana]
MSELKRKRCSDDELDSTKRIRLNTQGPSCYKGNEIGLQKRPIELIEEHSEAKQVRSMEPRKAVSAKNGFLDCDRARNTSGRNRNRRKQIQRSERFPPNSDEKTSDEKTIRCRKAEQKHGLYKELISTSPIDLSKERLNE